MTLIDSTTGRAAHLTGRRAASQATATTGQRLLTPGEVAALFRVDPKTVTRWARAGRLRTVRTLGGHRRYFEHEIQALLASTTTPTAQEAGC